MLVFSCVSMLNISSKAKSKLLFAIDAKSTPTTSIASIIPLNSPLFPIQFSMLSYSLDIVSEVGIVFIIS